MATRTQFERAIDERNARANDWRENDRTGHVSRVYGSITWSDNTVKQCYWDENGKCHNLRGYHMPSRDLKLPS